MSSAVEQFDTVIIGGRCAGSATAIALCQRGLRVLVIDAAHFPSDTLSTHLLWPSTLAEVAALGALPAVEAAGAPRLPLAEAILDDIGWRTGYSTVSGIDYAMCLRRTHLDAALVRTAIDAGAEVRERCRATGLVWYDGRVVGVRYTDDDDVEHEVRAPIVVGADGRKSFVAEQVGARTPSLTSTSGRSCYYAYWSDARTDLRHIATQWRVGRLLGVAFPCDGGDLLCLLQPPTDLDDEFRGRRAQDAYLRGIEAIPGLARRLDGCELVSRVRSCTGIESYFRQSSGPGWALPGDAGHFKDPVTAQGIRDALRYGRLLGEALAPCLGARNGVDPDAVDRATEQWATDRERDCIDIYQWTNFLASAMPPSPLEYELYHLARRDPEVAGVFADIYNRVQPPAAMMPPRTLVGALTRALRRPDSSARDVLADLRFQQRRMLGDWREKRRLLRSADEIDAPLLGDDVEDEDRAALLGV
ncbi:NAD(P)/FAD-dependent oxidoreductase [Gordonia rhizosphera]|uniref:Putative oxidoreductase n=1 Tax=Gordonia rhizosphera NBRC 16068 TaxID=1108045 RepID=K6V5I0_9ACTN|nr:NAD(P)/FAD-dependent oxidoreductase [Gordonia rhizosphera]GAB91498.1 putative oxidoreductase [Gordonia rhizosphera NBRC 16068]